MFTGYSLSTFKTGKTVLNSRQDITSEINFGVKTFWMIGRLSVVWGWVFGFRSDKVLSMFII